MWLPDLKNVRQPIPQKKLLRLAIAKLHRAKLWSYPKEVLKDTHGEYAYRNGHYLVLAKEYVFGDIISFHKTAIAKAIEHQIKMLLYLKDTDAFYEFDPEEILRNTTEYDENVKGKALMLNFPMKLGKRFVLTTDK